MSTFPDSLFQNGGQPVGGGRYEGMWEGDTFFVDYDNGQPGLAGTSAKYPGKYLQDAINAAGPWSVIYIRPRDPVYDVGGGANYHLPQSTSNWSIPYTAYGLSLIGAGSGVGNNVMATYLRGGAVTTAAPVLLIKSCWNNVENIAFHNGASLESQICSRRSTTAALGRAYANTYNRCYFRFGYDLIENNLGGCINIDSSSYEGIYNCTFTSSPAAIIIRPIQGSVSGIQIHGCVFQGAASEVQTDIFSGGGVVNISIKDCTFGHAVPAKSVYSATFNRYIYFGAASTGLVSNCNTGAVDPTIADNMTLNGVFYSHIWGDGIGPFVDA